MLNVIIEMVYKCEDLAWDWHRDVQKNHSKRDNLGRGEKPNPWVILETYLGPKGISGRRNGEGTNREQPHVWVARNMKNMFGEF